MATAIPTSARGKTLRKRTFSDLRDGDTIRLNGRWMTVGSIRPDRTDSNDRPTSLRVTFLFVAGVRLVAANTEVWRTE